jgi:molybdate transport system ATP-binding protein
LSGGERQRVALARALLASPRILLMDEPLASLDYDRKVEIMGLIERLRDEYRIQIIYVSHAIEEVSRLAGHVVVLEAGQVIAAGRPSEALSQMNRASHEDRFGLVSIIDCHIAAFDARFEVTSLQHSAGTIVVAGQIGVEGKPVRVLVHATDVALAVTRPTDLSIRTILSGVIATIQCDAGPSAVVEVALDGAGLLSASVTRLAISELDLTPGSRIYALIKAVAIDERPFHSP